MKCAECQENLSAYLENELVGSNRQEVADHMNECSTCLAEFKSLDRTHQLITDHIMIQAPDTLWSRIETRIKTPAAQPVPLVKPVERFSFMEWLSSLWQPMTGRVWAGAAATLLLIVGLVYFTQQQQ